jgi:hypothetical protein
MNDRAEQTFHMNVHDVFRFRDGRTVFAGPVDEGEDAILLAGKCDLIFDGKTAEIRIEPEMISSVPSEARAAGHRAVSTPNMIEGLPSNVVPGQIQLKGKARMHGHRDLVGIDSPPRDFVPDRMTLGPRLPDGWDGDAWTSVDETSFFLRAWNKRAARYAIGTGSRYEDARATLMEEIRRGGRKVEIVNTESAAPRAG